MGGLVGAALVFANYYHAIDVFEGGPGVRTLTTAGAFSTYAVRTHTNHMRTERLYQRNAC
jgi:aquaglyceroporin related protein